MITPLSCAIKGIADDKILTEVVKILLKFGADVNNLPYLVYTCQAGQYRRSTSCSRLVPISTHSLTFKDRR